MWKIVSFIGKSYTKIAEDFVYDFNQKISFLKSKWVKFHFLIQHIFLFVHNLSIDSFDHTQRYYNKDMRRSPSSSNLLFCVLCHNFWTNWGSDLFSTSKWPSDLSFVKNTYVDGGKLARNGRNTTIYISWVSQVRKYIFAFFVITSEPIKVQTRSAPQNDRLNLSFDKKMARNGRKTAIREGGSGRLLHNGDRRISLL